MLRLTFWTMLRWTLWILLDGAIASSPGPTRCQGDQTHQACKVESWACQLQALVDTRGVWLPSSRGALSKRELVGLDVVGHFKGHAMPTSGKGLADHIFLEISFSFDKSLKVYDRFLFFWFDDFITKDIPFGLHATCMYVSDVMCDMLAVLCWTLTIA